MRISPYKCYVKNFSAWIITKNATYAIISGINYSGRQTILTSLILVIALMICTAVITFILMNRKDKNSRPTPQAVRSVIMEGIQNVSELATVKSSFQSMIEYSSDKEKFLGIGIPGTQRKFMLQYNGTIKCGCDLKKIQVVYDEMANKAKVTLPRSEVLDIYADFNSIRMHDNSGIFTSVKPTEQNTEIIADLEHVKQEKIDDGMLALADKNVKEIVSSVITPLALRTGIQTEIEFDDEHTLESGSSMPQLEAGESK